MNIYDAIKVLGIESSEVTQDCVKKAYKVASKKYHPDINPATEEMMKLVNNANEVLMAAEFPISVKFKEGLNYGEELNKALNAIINFQGLVIEVCGSWVWISGETKAHKEELKAAGFKFSGKKKMWYFRPESKRVFWKKGQELSIGEIRTKYGSNSVKNRNPYYLGSLS